MVPRASAEPRRVSRAAIIEPAARRACVNIRVSNTDRSRDGRCAGSGVHAAQRAQGWAIVSESAGASVRRGGAEQGQGQGCLHGTLERDRMRRFTAARGLDVGQGARQHVLGARRPYRTPTAAPSAMVSRALRLFFAIKSLSAGALDTQRHLLSCLRRCDNHLKISPCHLCHLPARGSSRLSQLSRDSR